MHQFRDDPNLQTHHSYKWMAKNFAIVNRAGRQLIIYPLEIEKRLFYYLSQLKYNIPIR